jgi:nitric oxide reductase NorD protein
MLRQIRRRFEMLRARRVVLRKQRDGDEIDLESCIDALADLKAGSHMDEGLYRSCRAIERNMAIMLLIDVSGSTDAWVSSNRRIIDVEREALLLVGIALQELGEPYAIQAFSGEGGNNVTVRPVKSFDEVFDNDVALRISALEPERYTRAGAAIRHATAALMRRPADHRLLLLLSDGKPNDVDQYEGCYGVEDVHRAITEARLQGVFPFCLTIDRQAANYLPRIFGANQYALLQRPELLPTVLLDWMRRLITARQA